MSNDKSETSSSLTQSHLEPTDFLYFEYLKEYMKAINDLERLYVPQISDYNQEKEKYYPAIQEFTQNISKLITQKEEHLTFIKDQEDKYVKALNQAESIRPVLLRTIGVFISNFFIGIGNLLMWGFNFQKRIEYFQNSIDFNQMAQKVHEKYGETVVEGKVTDSQIDKLILTAINNFIKYHNKSEITLEELRLPKGFDNIRNKFTFKNDVEKYIKPLYELFIQNQQNLSLEEKIAFKASALDIQMLNSFSTPSFRFFDDVQQNDSRYKDKGNNLKAFLEQDEYSDTEIEKIILLKCILNCNNVYTMKKDHDLSIDSQKIDKKLDEIGKKIFIAWSDKDKVNPLLDELVSYCLEKNLDQEKFSKIISKIITFNDSSSIITEYINLFKKCSKIEDWVTFINSSKNEPSSHQQQGVFDTEKPDLNTLTNLIMRQPNLKALEAIKFRIQHTKEILQSVKIEYLQGLEKLIKFIGEDLKNSPLPNINQQKDKAQQYYNVFWGIMADDNDLIQKNLGAFSRTKL